jgi:hypothetical protein
MFDDRQHAGALVTFPDRRRAGTRRFAADVDDRCARRGHGNAALDSARRVAFEAVAVREAVGCDVENADDLRLVEPDQPVTEADRRPRRGQIGPGAPGALVQIVRQGGEHIVDLLDRDEVDRSAVIAVNADQLDRSKPEQAARQPRHLSVEAERAIDEAGGTKIESIAHGTALAAE